MRTISYTEARNGLFGVMKQAIEDSEPVVITRNGSGSVVMMSEGDYSAMEATLHLLSTPANAERIRQGLQDFADGNYQERALCD